MSLFLLASLAFGADELEHRSASMTMKVAKVEPAIDALLEKNKGLGGWFQSLDDTSVSLRVPTAKSDELLGFVEAQGIVVNRDYRTDDLREELAQATAKVKSREKLLKDYQGLLAKADRNTVVQLQSEIANVINQIERLKGRVRYLESRGEWAHVDVSFSFRDRTAPVRGGSSSFSWLNFELPTLNTHVQYGGTWDGKRPARPDADPEGFVSYRLKKEYRAVTSDGVMLVVRAVKHKPKADLDFWREALRNRMSEAGYTVLSEASPEGGYVLEMGAPFGAADWRYLVAIFPEGSKIRIVEAAGRDERFAAHRPALDAFLK